MENRRQAVIILVACWQHLVFKFYQKSWSSWMCYSWGSASFLFCFGHNCGSFCRWKYVSIISPCCARNRRGMSDNAQFDCFDGKSKRWTFRIFQLEHFDELCNPLYPSRDLHFNICNACMLRTFTMRVMDFRPSC